jgi:hypothetical protein
MKVTEHINDVDTDTAVYELGSGDSYYIPRFVDPEEDTHNSIDHACGKYFKVIQHTLYDNGARPYHRGLYEDCSYVVPVTSASTNWSETVLSLKSIVETIIKDDEHSNDWMFNQCTIFRGQMTIKEHSEKTLDTTLGSPLIYLNFGAPRVLRLKSKDDPRDVQEISLTSGSMFYLGWNTNIKYTHSVYFDRSYNVSRIYRKYKNNSNRTLLVFKSISTFKRPDGHTYGQGSTCKTEEHLEMNLQVRYFLLIMFVFFTPLFTEEFSLVFPLLMWVVLLVYCTLIHQFKKYWITVGEN